METIFKSTVIAQKLGVTIHTIRRWVLRFPDYFSEDARATSRAHSIYTLDDVRIFVTIATLSKTGFSIKSIEKKLAEGYRYEGSLDDIEVPQNEPQPKPKTKAVQTLEERLAEMSHKQEALETAFLERITELTSELTETKYQLGVAHGELATMKNLILKQQN